MQKRLFAMILALTSTVALLGCPAFAAVKAAQVDTITLEVDSDSEEIPVDLGWKTQQDQGQWIEEMGIGDDVNSLLLVINNLDTEEDPMRIPVTDESGTTVKRVQKKQLPGNSRMLYLSRTENGGWQENFSVNCYISGGQGEDSDIYGVYRLESTFGSEDNPGSLAPYQKLSENDYWITDPKAAGFGSIVSGKPETISQTQYVNLESMRAYSNYGMILKPEEGADGYPALVVNCQQSGAKDRSICGIQLPQSYVRILIQSMDSGTRILIAGEVEDLEGM